MRQYKIITGVAYPHLFNGKKQPTQITANLSDPNEYYYDDSIRLSEKDMAAYKGKPICVEHDPSIVIGEIAHMWKDAEGHMRMQARIFTDTPSGVDHYNRINRGDLSNLSVGYSVNADEDGHVTHKDYHEVSVCKQGFFPGAEISVCASGEKKYITNATNSHVNLLFSVMASETNFAAPQAAAAVPLDARNKDASELARVSDTLLQQQASDAARLKQLEQQVALYETAEKERLVQYANARKPKLDEVLSLLKEQFKEVEPNEAFPSEFEESAKNAFLNPEGERAAAVITANAMSYKKSRDELNAQRAKYAEMEQKMKANEAEAEVAKAHIRASDRMHIATESAVPQQVSANASRPNMSNLFMPSVHEKQLMKENYGITVDESKVNVNASASVTPTSQFDETTPIIRKFCPNSLFVHPQGKVNANWLRSHMDKFASARLAGEFRPSTEVMKE
jgi:HK97 family phage prohead protease